MSIQLSGHVNCGFDLKSAAGDALLVGNLASFAAATGASRTHRTVELGRKSGSAAANVTQSCNTAALAELAQPVSADFAEATAGSADAQLNWAGTGALAAVVSAATATAAI